MHSLRLVHAGFALSVGALVGCGSKSTPMTPVTTGSITVTVTPNDGTTPSVAISGPNAYSQTISTTTTLSNLAVGDYTIVADSAVVPDSIIGSITDTGHVVGSPAVVTAGVNSAVTVTYVTKDRVGGLWVAANFHPTIPLVVSSQLRQSGVVAAAETLSTVLGGMTGLALDASGNMWTSGDFVDSLAMYSITSRNAGGAPLPTVVIQTTAIYNAENLTFDAQGNLWVGNCGNHSGVGRVVLPGILAFSPAQLAAGGVVTPAISITSSAVLKCPHGVAFDGNGNAWVADDSNPQIVKFSAAQLTSSGDKTPVAAITGGGLVAAASVVFDAAGNLWVANDGGVSVIDYTPAQLAAGGTQTPHAVITLPNHAIPRGFAFDDRGTLWVSDWESDIMWGLSKSQLAATGSPAPSVAISVNWNGGQLLSPQQPMFDPFASAPAPSASRVRNAPIVAAAAIRTSHGVSRPPS